LPSSCACQYSSCCNMTWKRTGRARCSGMPCRCAASSLRVLGLPPAKGAGGV
jgi:hypothetical protein